MENNEKESTRHQDIVVSTNQSVSQMIHQNAISAPSSGSFILWPGCQTQEMKIQYQNNGDGTIMDMVTGSTWQKSPDKDGDGDIDAAK